MLMLGPGEWTIGIADERFVDMVVYIDRQKESPTVMDHHSPCRIVAISATAQCPNTCLGQV